MCIRDRYNTGVGWRNIIEKMHMTSTLTKWYEEHGRHEIFAGGKKVGLEAEGSYDLVLNQAHVDSAANDTFDKSGIAKNSREEKIRARDEMCIRDSSALLTNPICAEISNLYVPGVNGNGPSTAARIMTGYATEPVDNLITEFLPDVASHIHVHDIFVQRILNKMATGQYIP